ncbi:hypothetical protein BB558_006981 [Smittium angustum]|uniref:Potassium channel domain-containing protein n=1 Tax=Smittium angustum TaxID=133377 RepID=A0A2U1IW87_SMIAN|nr:hypothetical protein BB558_006981 [Smittium angustum]
METLETSKHNYPCHSYIDMSGQDSFSNQDIKSTEPKSLLFNSVTQQKPYKAPKKKSKIRWVISLAGFITPITLLLNGMFLTSSWFGDGGSVEYLISLEYNVVITTFLTVLLSTVCGLGSVILAIILPNIGKYRNLKSIINSDYYGSFFASLLNLLIAGLLVYDWIDTKNFEKKGSGMTRSQRRFHFSVLGVYIWTAIGAGIFMSLEKFDFYFAVYFCFVTITTIGFGDVVPIRASSRILTLIWLFVGIIIFGVYLINARDVIAQAVSTRYCKRVHKRRLKLNSINNHPIKIHKTMLYKTQQQRILDLEARTPNNERENSMLFTLLHSPFRVLRSVTRVTVFSKKNPTKKRSALQQNSKKLRMHAFSFFFMNLFLWLFCSLVFYFLEENQWTYPQALYFCFVSFTTVGYGDLTPKSRLSIIFFNFIIIIAVSTFAGYVASVVELYQDLLLSLLKRNVNHQQKHLQDPNHGMHNMMIGKLLGNPFKKGSTDITLSKTPQHQPPSEHSLEMENVYTTETKTEDTIENYVKITPSINN